MVHVVANRVLAVCSDATHSHTASSRCHYNFMVGISSKCIRDCTKMKQENAAVTGTTYIICMNE